MRLARKWFGAVGVGALLLVTGLLAGCSDDKPEVCTVGTAQGCENGQVCEQVIGGQPACFAPVQIKGRIFDAITAQGVADATIVALDANGGARSSVVRSGPDGSYTLPIAVPRAADGKPQHELVTLRVAALGYQPFPKAPRAALPVALDEAAAANVPWIIENAATDVALLALPGGATGLGTISGRVDASGLEGVSPGGVLVIAEVGGKAVSTAVSDTAGAFTLFNVPQGDVSVSGYRVGLRVAATPLNLSGALLKDVVLPASVEGLAPVTGSIVFANAPGGAVTSVLLVVESTFDETTKRGEAPAGLRVGEVTGAFRFEAVPPGRYVVLAAFENDGLVRDPDTTIGGTQIVHIEVAGAPVTIDTSFKVTGALAVVSPGATGLEVLPAGDPVLSWEDDSSEDGYELRVYNAFGDLVFEDTQVPRETGNPTVSYTWTGADLEPGMIYQFRVLSWRDKGGGQTYISATEDLLGVFQAP